MSTTQAPSARRALREEIENALEGGIAGTARWIASKISRPARLVRVELETRARQGDGITSRTTRGGDVLYKLTDANHHRWAALRGSPFTLHR